MVNCHRAPYRAVMIKSGVDGCDLGDAPGRLRMVGAVSALSSTRVLLDRMECLVRVGLGLDLGH